jgi:replicative DNA helicase
MSAPVLNHEDGRTPWTPVGTLAAHALAEAAIRTEHPDLRGLSTGLDTVDEKLSDALEPGRLIVVAGESGRGKSVLAAQLAVAFAHQVPVLWASLEDGGVDAVRRALANVARTPVSALRNGYRTGAVPAAAFDAQRALDELPLDLLDATGDVVDLAWTIGSWWRSQVATGPLGGVVIIDQLSHILPTSLEADVEERLARAGFPLPPRRGAREDQVLEWQVHVLRAMAEKLRLTVVLLHQLNDKRDEASKRPTMESIRGSRGITHKADALLVVWRPQKVENPWAGPGQPATVDAADDQAELICLKGRTIPQFSVKLRFDGAHQRFADGDESLDSAFRAPTAPTPSALEGAQRLTALRQRFAKTGTAELPPAPAALPGPSKEQPF